MPPGHPWRRPLVAPKAGDHFVQLYLKDSDLFKDVGRYAVAGLKRGDSVVLIARPEHQAGFAARLKAAGLKGASLRRSGRLVVLDAQETLSAFNDGSALNAGAFESLIGATIERARAASATGAVRGYGEMVDILWARSDRAAAIALEKLWNRLAAKHDFALYCAYRLDPLDPAAHADGLRGVCDAHTHLLPSTDESVLHDAVEAAIQQTLGSSMGGMLGTLTRAENFTTSMPDSVSRLFWLQEHIPGTAGRVLDRARAALQARRRS